MREVGPHDWRLTLRMIGAHTVPGCEVLDVEAGSYARLVSTATGPLAIEIVLEPEPHLGMATEDSAVAEDTLARVRSWLDLDHDPARLGPWRHDSVLGPLLAQRPGIRRIGYPEAFEAVVLTVLGQQVSLAAGRTFAGRLVQRYGDPGPAGLIVFPSPERLARASAAEIQAVTKVTGARARALQSAAAAFADNPGLAKPGPLPPDQLEACSERLAALPGVGPWTLAYLRLRLLGDLDAFPAGDLVLRRALGGVSIADAERLSQRWRPLRSYAVFSLWAGTAFPQVAGP